MNYRRDMNLIRNTLLEIEGGREVFAVLAKSYARAMAVSDDEALEDQEAKVLEHHLALIEGAGFASFDKLLNGTWHVRGLTWKSHEFLDNIRAKDIWDQASEHASDLGGFSMELLGDLAKGLVKTKIAKHTGIEL